MSLIKITLRDENFGAIVKVDGKAAYVTPLTAESEALHIRKLIDCLGIEAEVEVQSDLVKKISNSPKDIILPPKGQIF